MRSPIVSNGSTTNTLKATSGLTNSKTDFKMLEMKSGTSEAQIKEAIKGNDYDEVVFRSDEGSTFVLYADEIKGRVAPQDRIEVGGRKGTVLYTDNEWNENIGGAAVTGSLTVAGVLLGGPVGASLGAVGAKTALTALCRFAVGGIVGSVAGGVGGAAAGDSVNTYFGESDEAIKSLSVNKD